jgi:hypothetical protein
MTSRPRKGLNQRSRILKHVDSMTIPVENKAIFGNKAFKNKKKMIIN